MTNNKNVLNWVDEMVALCKPDKVVWIDGSKEQLEEIRALSVSTGEMVKLNEEKLPGCYIHRTAENDVARVEGRTFICTRNKEDAGPTNNWEDPKVMYEKLGAMFDGVMKGRTMYVIPYCMGPVGSKLSKVGVELTDSTYVVLNMAIMTRMGQAAWDHLGDESNDFVRGLHSKADIDEEKRYIVHFPEDNTIWSINSGYGGNVLLGKKCFALRIASFQGKNEGWMAEHMLILGLENPQGEVKYVTAAFPSACGKTNLAMLIPPEIYQQKGYKVWTVGDDIAWMRIGDDGRLWAINPENGFFGVAPGTNMKSNPNALISTQKDTIFTNVVHNLDENTVWWEGLDKNPPKNALDWKGNKWDPESGVKGAHPNSRFTAPAINCPCISSEFDNPEGVPVTAIVFGGRRAKTAPLVYQARDWEHGVFVGSIMASETTAAATGAVGVVRRDPMAMLPFCGYHMGDYFAHWLEMGKKLGDKAPKIFNVNWFRTDDEGHFIWPGFGDNMRVLEWIINRCDGKADAVETPIGYEPKPEDINLEGLDIDLETLKGLLSVDVDLWKEEAKGIHEFYGKFGDHLPKELAHQLEILEENLNK
ncbi:phosphoenolpyruvate carboxykinase (GTP) [bacterium 210820-DFI.6.52]|uniref:Phosphoenolpyruvate carboxykinase [GTP] n=1 Tax=Bittarella massiliensis (ex Durand et al. 2017) TaxID=1720313 RepID=A0AAQ1MCC2_9FIRM|nr:MULTISPECIES: phosphoenolpyruvate carboxykinase (GTP) [Eubacteriales]MCB5942390.1 phosphoenolpyruvate carboxykinase (GTP) [bacterium 210820-DFI.6.52]ERJ00151.1 phosphoenolpyruvate carboxykinase [Clostridium sp. ATCC 29733]MZL68440.1 phosphoenolpyruvate carboxykinase (GTP) [Bittarella massiliensis (ex Durand et al. 2017)]MZL79505.1 phosphoenolpyruvate carboxykinase (GTP) [Bittarella massiliensis (ex Durand et al. 2017)]SHF86342.1 phosphoenolpyruvate carboxykinase (GTP) [Bittarella massiliens